MTPSLSQEETDAPLIAGGVGGRPTFEPHAPGPDDGGVDDLSPDEREAVGETSGICMSSAAEAAAPLPEPQAPPQPRAVPTPVARPVAFPELGEPQSSPAAGDIGLLLDVPLRVTVELGRAQLRIRNVLELVPGSIIELDRLAGEPVDVLVNGKQIARGEVVVIDEEFGVRITDIASQARRLSGLAGGE